MKSTLLSTFFSFFYRPCTEAAPINDTVESAEDDLVYIPDNKEHEPIMNIKRIVVMGDGEEATLTAYLIAKDSIV